MAVKWDNLASSEKIEAVKNALEGNGVKASIAESKEQARELVLKLIPKGSEVMSMTSVTLEECGLANEFEDDSKYYSIGKKIRNENDKEKRHELRRKSIAPSYGVGSCAAVTEKGQLVWASATGSQLAPHAFGAQKVVLVVGAQKIVKDLKAALDRIERHTFPLEDERALKAYGVHSGINKLLVINKEAAPERIHVVLVKEKLGF